MEATERARLATQCNRILARLREGPASNADLAALSLKYTSRISDLRAAGHRIDCVSHDPATGRCCYRLLETGFDLVPRVVVPVPRGRLF